MSTFSELRVEPFTNFIGQVINPGDDVVAVTTAHRHRVNVFTGKFDGVYYDKYSNAPNGGTRVSEVPVIWSERVDCDQSDPDSFPDTRYDYNFRKYVPSGKFYKFVERKTFRKSCLQLSRVFKIDTTLDKVKF